jgi:hypothetical protein
MKLFAQSVNELSIYDCMRTGDPFPLDCTGGPGERKGKRKPLTDDPPPQVSVTVDKNVLDALRAETKRERVGGFVQLLLQDWVDAETKKRKKRV